MRAMRLATLGCYSSPSPHCLDNRLRSRFLSLTRQTGIDPSHPCIMHQLSRKPNSYVAYGCGRVARPVMRCKNTCRKTTGNQSSDLVSSLAQPRVEKEFEEATCSADQSCETSRLIAIILLSSRHLYDRVAGRLAFGRGRVDRQLVDLPRAHSTTA
ncbi:unnamed protein product [Protopolystoma xenopodis]|uniref:Uncharacterized protein n=1 Tax=Protopolystoma xenopodis TaxID=117903 RepID=A0A448XJW3_9PLAT|nr:unnamed protein product [Protopolystoma xenopodis]